MKWPARSFGWLLVLALLAVTIAFKKHESPVRTAPAKPLPAGRLVEDTLPPPPATQREVNSLPPVEAMTSPKPADPLAALKRQFDDPARRAASLAAARARVEARQGRLFQRLRKVAPGKIERLKDLLAEADLAMQRESALGGAHPGPGGAEEAAAQIARIESERDQQIKALLEAADYASYTGFQQSYPYREAVGEVTAIMRAHGATVSDDLQETLVDAYAAAIAAAAKASAAEAGSGEWSALTLAQRENLRLQQLSRLDGILADTMGKVLSPADYKAFMDAQFAQDGATR